MSKKVYTDDLLKKYKTFVEVITPYLNINDYLSGKNFDLVIDITKSIYIVIEEIEHIMKQLYDEDDEDDDEDDEYYVNIQKRLSVLTEQMKLLLLQVNISSKIFKIQQGDYSSQLTKLYDVLNTIITLFYSKEYLDTNYKDMVGIQENIQQDIIKVEDIHIKPTDDNIKLLMMKSVITKLNDYFSLYCVSKNNTELFKIIIYLHLLDNSNMTFRNNDNSYLLDKMNSITLSSSYFESLLIKCKTDIAVYIDELNNENIIDVDVKKTIIDIYENIVTFINTYFIPFNLNLKYNETSDFQIFNNPDFFEKYLIEHIKIYNPSPCENLFKINYNVTSNKINNANIILNKMNDIKHKQNYKIYYFSNNNNKMYYYSIFYKINTKHFLNPTAIINILDNFELHQCLIMNSTFDGNDAYKYGKFLYFLNKILFTYIVIQKSNIICFVNKSKTIADELFAFLNNNKLFNTPSTHVDADGVTQNIKIDNHKCKYLKYTNISFYTKENEPKYHIELILEKFEIKPAAATTSI